MSRSEDEQVAELEASLADDERQLLDQLADGLVERRLLTPALFLLESMKPLAFVGSQALVFFRPVVQMLWSNPIAYDRIARLLERRGALELLLRRLEARA